MSGPAPKHPSTRARRNDAKKGFTVLAPDARKGKKAPAWPLQPMPHMVARIETGRDRVAQLQVLIETEEDGRKLGRMRRELNHLQLDVATLQLQLEQARDAEIDLWEQLWLMPQAVIWEETHASREVAQYVRWKIQAEQGDLKAATEARQLSDRLGLNPLALSRLRVEIEHADAAQQRGEQRRAPRGKTAGGDKDDPRRGLYAV